MQELEGNIGRHDALEVEKREWRTSPLFYGLDDPEHGFERLPPKIARTKVIDFSGMIGCHYGGGVYGPVLDNLLKHGISIRGETVHFRPGLDSLIVNSTGNGWMGARLKAEEEEVPLMVVMPAGLPEARYKDPRGEEVFVVKRPGSDWIEVPERLKPLAADGRCVLQVLTPAEEYAVGMRKQLEEILRGNRQRRARGEGIYICPDHSVGGAEIFLESMSRWGKLLAGQIEEKDAVKDPVIVGPVGNGSSTRAVLGVAKERTGAKVVLWVSVAYARWYDRWRAKRGLSTSAEDYGLESGHPVMMKAFDFYGLDAPLFDKGDDRVLPHQEAALEEDLADDCVLVRSRKLTKAYMSLGPSKKQLERFLRLPDIDELPKEIYERCGNSSLGDIAVAAAYPGNEDVYTIIYDSRGQY